MKITIKVTKDHIKNGIRNSYSESPLVIALRDAGCMGDVYTETTFTMFRYKGMRFMFATPEKLSRFLIDFDSKKKVEPFEFELEF